MNIKLLKSSWDTFRYQSFRDDFRRTDKSLEANKTKINFIVENKKVILLMMCYLPVVVFDQH
jgi:pyrimidine operon attenuation protein/uracil phosphoribosyltransferase